MKTKLAASFMLVAFLSGLAVFAAHAAERQLGMGAFFVSLFALMLVALGGAVLLAQRLSRRLSALAGTARVIAEGDLTVAVDTRRNGFVRDEIDDLAESFAAMRQALVRVLAELQDTSNQMTSSARGLSRTAQELSGLTEEIAQTSTRLAGGAEQTARRIGDTEQITRQVARDAERIGAGAVDALSQARRTEESAQTGRCLAEQADAELEHIGDEVDRMSAAVEGFRARASSINKTVEMIASIAQQTHMVALNAAIEAARAGEHGEGFAVVAEEVRLLAERAGRYAEKISAFADQINAGSEPLIGTLREAIGASRAGRQVVHGAGEALHEIAEGVAPLVARIEEIAGLASDQERATEDLVRGMEEISRIAREGVEGIEETSAATGRQNASMEAMATSALGLAGTSERLRELCGVFRVGDQR